jgi:hypothetical protein
VMVRSCPLHEGTPGGMPGVRRDGSKGTSAAVPGPEGATGPSSRSATPRRSAPSTSWRDGPTSIPHQSTGLLR